MAVTDTQTVDGIAFGSSEGTLILEIYDHLDFEGKFEFDHIAILQDKLNAYIGFINSRQYEEVYPGKAFDRFIININFLNNVSENCRKYISNANFKLRESNIQIAIQSENEA